MVELAQSGIERVVSYSDNLLDLSAFERRKIVFNIEIHNLQLLAKDVVDEFNKANYNSNHIITFYYHPQAEIIFELDYTRIRQVLHNLISNAIQYTDSGIIAVKVLPYRQGAQIIIEDEGVGIPEDELENIFKPFQESSRTRSQAQGCGLGLTVAREIILHHHGVIFAGNRSGTKGSKFTVQLPIRQPQGNFNKGFHSKNQVFGNPKPYNQPVEDIIKNTSAFSQKINTIDSLKDAEKHIRTHKSIMIIDDDQSFLDTVSLDIFAERYQPRPVLSPFEAISLIKDNPSFYSMIILDMNMPGKSCSDVLHEVNDIIRMYSIPVVVISGYEQPLEIRTLLYALGVKNFIIKPYSTHDIHNLINLHLRQSAMFPFNLSNSKI